MTRATSTIVLALLALLAVSALAQQPSRRVRVRTRPLAVQQEEAEERSAEALPQVQYYAVQPQEEEEPQAVVVVQQPRGRASNPAAYSGLYGNQVSSRQDEEYRPSARPLSRATSLQAPRTKESRPPPIQTTRNYNTINDDGSFTFGYEAEDGSFKEETRGTDCVVRGKYGYIDPDGNKREFTYVSGNPCDPNNPDPEEDERELEDDSSEENVPLRPQRPLRPIQHQARRPAPPPSNVPSQAVFQNNFIHGQRIQQAKVVEQPQQVPITPRPVQHLRTALPATTYRPQIQNYPAVTTPRPAPQQIFYTSSPAQPTPTARALAPIQHTTPTSVDFDAELKKFQLEAGSPTFRTATTPAVAVKSRPASQNVLQTQQFVTPRPVHQQPLRAAHAQPQRPVAPTSNPYYSSQLVFDPSTGQYNTAHYQQLPQGGGDFSANFRLQPYVQPQQHHQPQSVFLNPQQGAFQPSPTAFRQAQQQPAANPAPQFAPQQYSRPPLSPNAPTQSFYYINPNLRNQYSTGQIDDFLRGHNIQF